MSSLCLNVPLEFYSVFMENYVFMEEPFLVKLIHMKQKSTRTLFFCVKIVHLCFFLRINSSSFAGTAYADLIFTHGCYSLLPHQPTELFTTSKRHST